MNPTLSNEVDIQSSTESESVSDLQKRIKVASFNIQTGIDTSNYRQYITRSWQHLLPSGKKESNLDRIADVLRPFDVVGLQEVDGGGARSQFTAQTEYLAHKAGFDHWHHQINRKIGPLAFQSNGLISQLKPHFIHNLKLPGFPGRGAVLVRFGHDQNGLHLCTLHLALGKRARHRQMLFISKIIRDLPHVILMGDLNCEPDTPEMEALLNSTHLCKPEYQLNTFPSWRPHRKLDHILVTPGLKVENLRVLKFACSDHLPIAMDITLPEDISLAA